MINAVAKKQEGEGMPVGTQEGEGLTENMNVGQKPRRDVIRRTWAR